MNQFDSKICRIAKQIVVKGASTSKKCCKHFSKGRKQMNLLLIIVHLSSCLELGILN